MGFEGKIRVLLVAGIVILLCATAGCMMFNAVKTGDFGSSAGGSGGAAGGDTQPSVSPAGGQNDNDDIMAYVTLDCKYTYYMVNDAETETATVNYKGEIPLLFSRYQMDHNMPYGDSKTTQLHMTGVYNRECKEPCIAFHSTYDGPVWVEARINHPMGAPKKSVIANIQTSGYMHDQWMSHKLDKYVSYKKMNNGDVDVWSKDMVWGVASEYESFPSNCIYYDTPFTFQEEYDMTYSHEDQYSKTDSTATFHIGRGSRPLSVITTDTLAPLVTTPKK